MNKFTICAVVFVSFFVFFGCTPRKAGIVLSVDGKEFSNAEVFINNRKIGHFKQMVAKSTGEIYIDGEYIRKDTSSPLIGKEDNYSGHLDFFSLEPGTHHIALVARSGKRVEIEVRIDAGENYVSFSPEKGKLQWNNDEYKIVPDKLTKIR